MDTNEEKRARRLVDMLESAGPSCGLIGTQGAVAMRCPGGPIMDSPTPYDEADLNNAVALNVLEERKMRAEALTGIFEREYYVVREKSIN